MRHLFFLILFIAGTCNSFGQNIDKRYIIATEFINDSINLYKEFKSNYPNRCIKKKKKNYTGYVVSSEIVNFDFKPFLTELINNDNFGLDKNIIKRFKIDSAYYKKTNNNKLISLSTNNESVLILYFSNLFDNILFAEILPCRLLMAKKNYEGKLFYKEKKDTKKFEIDKSFRYNAQYNKGLLIKFLFNDKGEIIYYDISRPNYN